MEAEQSLMDTIEMAGASIGHIIALGSVYKEATMKQEMYSSLTEFVMESIGDGYTRESLNYAEVIGFTNMVWKWSSLLYEFPVVCNVYNKIIQFVWDYNLEINFPRNVW